MARPKGYITDWRPRANTLALIAQVEAVLTEYRRFWPLTVRQIFYRLVGVHGYPKTEQAYGNLGNHVANARRAGVIQFHAIRDDGSTVAAPSTYRDPAAFWNAVRYTGEHFRRDLLRTQPLYVEVWCEAAGMVPQLAAVCDPYCVPVYSSSGFNSLTVKKELADRVGALAQNRERGGYVLHLGDFDPSGESIYDSLAEDVGRFIWADTDAEVVFQRIALTSDQVSEYDLDTAPPKASDSRSINWEGETCQLEALPPDTLAEVLNAALSDLLDHEQLEQDRQRQATERAGIAALLADMPSES